MYALENTYSPVNPSQGSSQYIAYRYNLRNSQVNNNTLFLDGATLAGMYRLRGFRQRRFYDKAVIYATAEYCTTLDYNPTDNVRGLNFLNLDWLQTFLYIEEGAYYRPFIEIHSTRIRNLMWEYH